MSLFKPISMTRFCLLLVLAVAASQVLQAQVKTKQERGFFNITNPAEIQYLRSIDSSIVENGLAVVKGGFEAHTINGYFVNPNMSVGLGAGIQIAKVERSYDPGFGTGPSMEIGPDMLLLPVFADFRYYPRNTRNAPMFIINVGYAPLLNGTQTAKTDLNGGALVKVGGGYKIHLGNTVSFLPAFSCRAQRYGENTVVGAVLSLGFMF